VVAAFPTREYSSTSCHYKTQPTHRDNASSQWNTLAHTWDRMREKTYTIKRKHSNLQPTQFYYLMMAVEAEICSAIEKIFKKETTFLRFRVTVTCEMVYQ
jgi:hypothetical protein